MKCRSWEFPKPSGGACTFPRVSLSLSSLNLHPCSHSPCTGPLSWRRGFHAWCWQRQLHRLQLRRVGSQQHLHEPHQPHRWTCYASWSVNLIHKEDINRRKILFAMPVDDFLGAFLKMSNISFQTKKGGRKISLNEIHTLMYFSSY